MTFAGFRTPVDVEGGNSRFWHSCSYARRRGRSRRHRLPADQGHRQRRSSVTPHAGRAAQAGCRRLLRCNPLETPAIPALLVAFWRMHWCVHSARPTQNSQTIAAPPRLRRICPASPPKSVRVEAKDGPSRPRAGRVMGAAGGARRANAIRMLASGERKKSH